MYKLIIVAALLLSGCYLNEKHYNDVMNVDSNVQRLDKKDQQMHQDIEAIKAAAHKKSQRGNK
ncbi:MAG: hypothetical protein R8K54_06305 [Mariprofundaceae bacterium]